MKKTFLFAVLALNMVCSGYAEEAGVDLERIVVTPSRLEEEVGLKQSDFIIFERPALEMKGLSGLGDALTNILKILPLISSIRLLIGSQEPSLNNSKTMLALKNFPDSASEFNGTKNGSSS